MTLGTGRRYSAPLTNGIVARLNQWSPGIAGVSLTIKRGNSSQPNVSPAVTVRLAPKSGEIVQWIGHRTGRDWDEKPNSLLDDTLLDSSGSQSGSGNLDPEVESGCDSEVGTDDPVAVQCALAPHGGLSEKHETWGSAMQKTPPTK